MTRPAFLEAGRVAEEAQSHRASKHLKEDGVGLSIGPARRGGG